MLLQELWAVCFIVLRKALRSCYIESKEGITLETVINTTLERNADTKWVSMFRKEEYIRKVHPGVPAMLSDRFRSAINDAWDAVFVFLEVDRPINTIFMRKRFARGTEWHCCKQNWSETFRVFASFQTAWLSFTWIFWSKICKRKSFWRLKRKYVLHLIDFCSGIVCGSLFQFFLMLLRLLRLHRKMH